MDGWTTLRSAEAEPENPGEANPVTLHAGCMICYVGGLEGQGAGVALQIHKSRHDVNTRRM